MRVHVRDTRGGQDDLWCTYRISRFGGRVRWLRACKCSASPILDILLKTYKKGFVCPEIHSLRNGVF